MWKQSILHSETTKYMLKDCKQKDLAVVHIQLIRRGQKFPLKYVIMGNKKLDVSSAGLFQLLYGYY